MRPISSGAWRTTVTGVASMSASSKSSKPTSAIGARRVAQRAQRADRVAVVRGEHRGRAALRREGEQRPHELLGVRGVVRAGADQLVARFPPRIGERGAVARRGARAAV